MTDKLLQKKLLKKLSELEKLIDAVGPTPLRRKLDQHRVEMVNAIEEFDQCAYDKGE